MPSGQSVICHRVASFAVASAVVLATALTGSPAAAVPTYTPEERALAIASPSMVFLEAMVTGYLRRTDTGEALQKEPFVLDYRCSGFVVSQQGHVVTSGHCLLPGKGSYRNSSANLLADARIKAGSLRDDQRNAFIADVFKTADFVGENLVSAPTVQVYGQLFQGKGLLKADPAWLAESVNPLSGGKGDVTLVKFPAAGSPVAELSSEQPAIGSQIVAMGFKAESASWTADYKINSIGGKITGQYGTASPTQYEMDQDLGRDTRGGLIVDVNGKVVGLINADPSTKDRPNRIVTNIDSIKAALSDNSATNSLGPVDQAYRTALEAYFTGHYSEAIRKLDGVIAAFPQHSVARAYHTKASQLLSTEGDAGIPQWKWIVAGLAAVVLVSAVVFIMLIRRLRRLRRTPDPYAMATTYPIMPMQVSGGGAATYEYQPPQQIQDASGDQPQQTQPYTYQDYWATPPPPTAER